MNSPKKSELIVLLMLVLFGVASRLYFRDMPNFSPVAALALFSGYYFRTMLAAVCVPLAVMAISDVFIGGYDLVLMLAVYLTLASPVAIRAIPRRLLDGDKSVTRRIVSSVVVLWGCAIGCSLTFFLITNFSVWATSGIYDRTLLGLMQCYASAIPFFRNTLASDTLFAFILFGGHCLVCWPAPANNRQHAVDAA